MVSRCVSFCDIKSFNVSHLDFLPTLIFCSKAKRNAGDIGDVTEKASSSNISHTSFTHWLNNLFSHLMNNSHRTIPRMKRRAKW